MSDASITGERPKKGWPAFVASFMLNDLKGIIRKFGFDDPHQALPPEQLRDILTLLYEGHIDRSIARNAVIWQIEKNQEAREFIKRAMDRMTGKVAIDATCRKCDGEMIESTALEQGYSGLPDFPGDTSHVTMSQDNSQTKLVACRKCRECGWSVNA